MHPLSQPTPPTHYQEMRPPRPFPGTAKAHSPRRTTPLLLRLRLARLLVAAIVLLAGPTTYLFWRVSPYASSSPSYEVLSTMPGLRGASASPRTLVLYVYHETDEWYQENLRFFLRVAMDPTHDSDVVDYVLVVNGDTKLPLTKLLAATPAHREGRVRVVHRPNTCYDGGTMGEVLRAYPRLATAYRYFVLMNASVRGPFLPRYFAATVGGPWTAVLTSLLSDETKLVGTTLSCQTHVHVQSMVLATDRVGLAVLQERGVLKCPATLRQAIHTYELQASAAILDAG